MLNAQSTGLTHKLEFLPNRGDFMRRNIARNASLLLRSGVLLIASSAVALFALFASAHAATIDAAIGGRTAAGLIFLEEQQALNALNLSVADSGSDAFGSVAASASVNAQTGKMKFSLNANTVAGNSTASALLTVLQEVTVTGTGSLSVFLEYDALTNVENASLSVFAGLLTEPGRLDFQFPLRDNDFATFENGQASGIVGSRANFNNAVDESVTMSFLMNGIINTALSDMAFLDASNTGTFYFETTGDLIVTSTTPGFLTGPDNPVAPVPVPAGWILLSSSLWWLGRRRSLPA